jgi:hypothetical protein
VRTGDGLGTPCDSDAEAEQRDEQCNDGSHDENEFRSRRRADQRGAIEQTVAAARTVARGPVGHLGCEIPVVSATYGSFEPTARHAVATPVGKSTAPSRDEVRSEARAAGRNHAIDSLYVGG